MMSGMRFLPDHGERVHAVDDVAAAVGNGVERHAESQVREAAQQCGKRDAHLGACQRCADAVVDAVPERDVTGCAAAQVEPGLIEQARTNGRRWETEMASDGLHPDRILLIARALDGDAMAEMFDPDIDVRQRHVLRDLLLALSKSTGPLH